MGLKSKGVNIPWPKTTTDNELKETIWIDEAGMGSWAGPLYIGAAYLLPEFNIIGIHDSKLLKPHERDKLYEELISSPYLVYHVESVSNAELDQVGGLGIAWRLGIRRAVASLVSKIEQKYPEVILKKAVLDGNKCVEDCKLPIVPVSKADQVFVGVSVAAILAKVSRDRYMVEIADNYSPDWKDIFQKGKGYRHSQNHSDLINQKKFTDLHRRSYNPLKRILAGRIVTKRMQNK
jgi:ribonuclease HII